MKSLLREISLKTFYLLCIFATVALQIYCIKRFLEDEDMSVVRYTKFHSKENDIYPSFSFCIVPPFLPDKFEEYGDSINITSYIKFLKGELWNEEMLYVDYDKVTISLEKNLFRYLVRFSGHKPYPMAPNYYTSFRSAVRKCFTFDSPVFENRLIWYLRADIKKSVFQNSIRPSGFGKIADGRLYTYIHYPGQRLTSYYTVQFQWKKRSNTTEYYRMKFYVKNIDSTRYRHKMIAPCIENWKNYDEYIMDQMMTKAGCQPPHWKTKLGVALCSNSTDMRIFKDQPSTKQIQSYDPPCKVIERLDYVYNEVESVTG